MKAMRLRYLAAVTSSNVDKLSAPDEVPVRLCNYIDVYKNDRITSNLNFMSASATPAEIAKLRLRVGDVIITKDSEERDDIAIPAYVAETAPDLVCGYHLALLRARPDRMRGDFLFWALQSKPTREEFSIAAGGVTRFGLTLDGMKSVKLACPDLPTQRSIADFLDRETARIDHLIEKKQRLIDATEAEFFDRVTLAVTMGVEPSPFTGPSGYAWHPEIPKGWKATRLKFLCANIVDCLHETPEHIDDGEYPSVRTADVTRGKLDVTTAKRVSETEYLKRRRYR